MDLLMKNSVFIFSGSFNPFHSGHGALLGKIVSDGNKVIVMPKEGKSNGANLAPLNVRTAITDTYLSTVLTPEEKVRVVITSCSINHQDSYRVYEAQGGTENLMPKIVGSDAMFKHLRYYQRNPTALALKESFYHIFLRKEDTNTTEMITLANELKINYQLHSSPVNQPMSSTIVRECLVKGYWSKLQELYPRNVLSLLYQYIEHFPKNLR
jgi:nicotinic acid mononucleotide adenylyltransferase